MRAAPYHHEAQVRIACSRYRGGPQKNLGRINRAKGFDEPDDDRRVVPAAAEQYRLVNEADLTDAQAFDVAAFINSQPRPQMANLDRDYPDRSTTPIDGPYGPYADDFPIDQHRFGPFKPIEQYYLSRKQVR